jgi:Fic family protein
MITLTAEHIWQSNLIEGVTDEREFDQSWIAWKYLEHQELITFPVVLQTHNLIMKNLMPQRLGGRGSLRVHNVTVGERSCPHWSDVPDLLDGWIVKMERWRRLSPKQMHIEYEHIHPFRDGNGRTGRMFMWWHEIKQGEEPTFIAYDERWKYYEWF